MQHFSIACVLCVCIISVFAAFSCCMCFSLLHVFCVFASFLCLQHLVVACVFGVFCSASFMYMQRLAIGFVHLNCSLKKKKRKKRDNEFVFKIRALHCTLFEFQTGVLAGGF